MPTDTAGPEVLSPSPMSGCLDQFGSWDFKGRFIYNQTMKGGIIGDVGGLRGRWLACFPEEPQGGADNPANMTTRKIAIDLLEKAKSEPDGSADYFTMLIQPSGNSSQTFLACDTWADCMHDETGTQKLHCYKTTLGDLETSTCQCDHVRPFVSSAGTSEGRRENPPLRDALHRDCF